MGVHEADLVDRPGACPRRAVRPRAALARRAASPQRQAALRPRTGGGEDRVTFEEARAQFPVFEHYAYLNAGTNGPLARATVDAMLAQERADLELGRGGPAYFERALEL